MSGAAIDTQTQTRDARVNLDATRIELGPETEAGGKKVRRFKMTAYTGAPVQRWWGRAVFDLAGLEHGDQVPMLFCHDGTRIAGHADKAEITPAGLELEGVVSSRTEEGRLVAELADDGFRWQASIGVEVISWEEVREGFEVEVNGRALMGPISVARRSRLLETSFLPSGADGDTRAEVMAPPQKETVMDPKAFAAANPAAVEAWKKEGQELGAKQAREGLSAYLAAFPGREAWAAARYTEGKSLLEAKAALADVLGEELAAARAGQEKDAAAGAAAGAAKADDQATLARLRAEAGNPGVGFAGAARQDPAGENLSAMEPEVRLRKRWLGDAKLRAEFANNLNAYLAYASREGEEAAK